MINPVSVLSWSDELLKLAVQEYLDAYDRPALRVAKPPNKEPWESKLTAENFPAEARRRYPGIRAVDTQAKMVEAMGRRLSGKGIDPSSVRVEAGPGLRSAASGLNVTVGSLGSTTVGHELGHVVDSKKGHDFFGDRGFFGWGGDSKTMIPSEVSATRQALRARRLPPAERADVLAATGTYLESAGRVKGREGYEEALSSFKDPNRHKAEELIYRLQRKTLVADDREAAARAKLRERTYLLDDRIRRSHEKARAKKLPLELFGTRVDPRKAEKYLRTRREAKGRRFEDLYAMKESPGYKRWLKAHQQRVDADPDIRRALRLEKAQGHMRTALDRPVLLRGRGGRLLSGRDRAVALSDRLDKTPNPFIEPLWEKMKPSQRSTVQTHIDSMGAEIGKEFGESRRKTYLAEMRKGLENPLRRGFKHLPGVVSPAPKAPAGFLTVMQRAKRLGIRLGRKVLHLP